jgi:uncharacterized OB-fold protein
MAEALGTTKDLVMASNPLTPSSSHISVAVDPARLKLTNPDGTDGVLLGFRCRHCGVYCFGPAIFCQACTSEALDSVELSKQGTLYSYTIVRVPPPGWPGPVPYILGQVELPEGPHVLAEVVDCQASDLKIGMAMKLALKTAQSAGSSEEKVVYKWRPVSCRADAKEETP